MQLKGVARIAPNIIHSAVISPISPPSNIFDILPCLLLLTP